MLKTYSRDEIVALRHDLNHVLSELHEFKERYHGARRTVMSQHIDRCMRIQNFLFAMENAPPPVDDPRLIQLIGAVLTGIAANPQAPKYADGGAKAAINVAESVLEQLAERTR